MLSIMKGLFSGLRTLLTIDDPKLLFFHAFGIDHLGWNSIVLGLLILVIAVLFKRAYLIQEEQSLTV